MAIQGSDRSGMGAAWKIVLVLFLAIAAYFLVTEHNAHVVSVLPWLLLFAVPFLHLFMHGGHDRHSGKSHGGEQRGEQIGESTPQRPHDHGGPLL